MNQGQYDDISGALHRIEDMARERNRLLERIAVAVEAQPSPQAGYLWTNTPRPDLETPLSGYDDMTAKEIAERALQWSAATKAAAYAYEAANKNRKTVLEALEAD